MARMDGESSTANLRVTQVKLMDHGAGDLIGDQQIYFWKPENQGRRFHQRTEKTRNFFFGLGHDDWTLLPNARNGDLGVPVYLGEDSHGISRYVYLFGDTGDHDNFDELGNNRGGFGGDRIAGNVALLAHKDEKGALVLDGLVRDPRYRAMPWEPFPVELPHRVGSGFRKLGRFHRQRYPDGDPRSVVPTGAALVGGELVVAWQQINWGPGGGGPQSGEGSWVQSFSLTAHTTTHSKIDSSVAVPVGDPAFQQIQFARHTVGGQEEFLIVGSCDSRTNKGPHLARATAADLIHPERWHHFGPHGWGEKTSSATSQERYVIPNFPNVGEGGAAVIEGKLVIIYTEENLGVVLRSAPLDDLHNFSPPQAIVTRYHASARGSVSSYFNEPGGPYGGFIQEVNEKERIITIVMSRWVPYSSYLLQVHYQ